MTWRFRRSKNFGPVRVSLSRRGLGASVGLGDVMRVSLGADGKVRRSVRIPGTGAYNVEVVGHRHHDPHATDVIRGVHDAPTTRLPAVAVPRRASGGGGRLLWGVVRTCIISFAIATILLWIAAFVVSAELRHDQVVTPDTPSSTVSPEPPPVGPPAGAGGYDHHLAPAAQAAPHRDGGGPFCYPLNASVAAMLAWRAFQLAWQV